MDKLIDLINQGGTGEYDARQPERGEAVAYLCDGMRFKVAATSSTMPVVGIAGLPAALAGRWVALVAADDDCHLTAAPEPAAWKLRKDGRMWTTHIKRSMENYAGLGAEVTPLYAHPPAVDARVAELEARISDLELEAQLETCIREKLSEILTRTANVLKGEPDELTVHSWHDLAEIAGRRIAALDQQLAASREREGRMREALRHGRGIVPGGLWTSIELCAPNESPVKPGEYEDQYRFGWNACRAEVLRNMAALAAEKEKK